MTPLPPPVSTGLLAIAAALIDPESVRRLAQKVFVPAFRRVATSMPLAAAMLAEALERAGPDPAPYRNWLDRPENEIAFRFLDLVAVKAPWERALESLEAMLSPAQAVAPAPAARTKRLVWLVDPDREEIRPLEQALLARGWTAGRPVALKRLYQGDPALDYLDEFDRRACGLIRRTVAGWRNQEQFECRAGDMLPALVGHPRVFDARSPARPSNSSSRGRNWCCRRTRPASASPFLIPLSRPASRSRSRRPAGGAWWSSTPGPWKPRRS